jgi:hypothetical protein
MNARDELVDSLKSQGTIDGETNFEEIADFIIADRKTLIEKIMNLYSSDEWKGLETLRGIITENTHG